MWSGYCLYPLITSEGLLLVSGLDSYCWDIFHHLLLQSGSPTDDDIKVQTLTVVVAVSHLPFSSPFFFGPFSLVTFFFLHIIFLFFLSYFSDLLYSISPCVTVPSFLFSLLLLLLTLSSQRRALRPGTGFSVRSRSWWRKSSRLQDYGRARTTDEECSSPTKTREPEAAAATALWSRRRAHTHTHTRSNIHTHTLKYEHTHSLERTASLLRHEGSGGFAVSPPLSCKGRPSPLCTCVHTDTTFCTLCKKKLKKNNNAALKRHSSSAFLLMTFEQLSLSLFCFWVTVLCSFGTLVKVITISQFILCNLILTRQWSPIVSTKVCQAYG